MSICTAISSIKQELSSYPTQLIAVSKTQAAARLLEAYDCGQRAFGENRVQELVEKATALPDDIQWHFIGHLQRNKVKYIAPFVDVIHAVDSWRLLQEIDKRAAANKRTIKVLLQFKIAQEDSKYGLGDNELYQIVGVMGMATFTDNQEQIRAEFQQLSKHFSQLKDQYFDKQDSFTEISMGMSGDYPIALEEGSTMVRVGSKIFGARNY